MPQSLKHQNNSTYLKKYEDELLEFAKKENLKQRFELGDSFSEDEALHIIMMQSKLCPINCEVYEFLSNKIKEIPNNEINADYDGIMYSIKNDKNNDYIFDWYELQW